MPHLQALRSLHARRLGSDLSRHAARLGRASARTVNPRIRISKTAPGEERISVAIAVAWFAVAGLVALVLVAVVAAILLRQAGGREATAEAERVTALAARGIIQPAITPGVLERDPAALAALDHIVRDRVLGAPFVRVKLWRTDGTILYSDEPRLIGRTFPLADDEKTSLRLWKPVSDVSNLSSPENQLEPQNRELMEVYMPVSAPDGQPLLFETYQALSSVDSSRDRILRVFAPALIIALVALWIVQLPLAWSLARRLRHRQEERERLLRHAIESSDHERRRIARDLHDGAVQDLVGAAYGLAAAAERKPAGADAEHALRDAAEQARRTIRGLRTLLVDLYPPNLHQEGLAAALSDLSAPLPSRGIQVELDVDEEIHLDEDLEAVLFRIAQEAIRNVAKHSRASQARVTLRRARGLVVLEVSDDGAGFDVEETAARTNGHFGLVLIADVAKEAGVDLAIQSAPGDGTLVRVEAPA
jgi:signal transduction histidine kinase